MLISITILVYLMFLVGVNIGYLFLFFGFFQDLRIFGDWEDWLIGFCLFCISLVPLFIMHLPLLLYLSSGVK